MVGKNFLGDPDVLRRKMSNLKYKNDILKLSLQESDALTVLQYAYSAIRFTDMQSNYRNAY